MQLVNVHHFNRFNPISGGIERDQWPEWGNKLDMLKVNYKGTKIAFGITQSRPSNVFIVDFEQIQLINEKFLLFTLNS